MNRQPFLERCLRVLSLHERVVRVVTISALVAIVGIDLFELSDEFADAPVLGLLYVALIGGAATAIDLLAQREHRGWLLAASVGVASIGAFLADRAIGAPTTATGTSAWSGPLGVASLIASVGVVIASVAAICSVRSD